MKFTKNAKIITSLSALLIIAMVVALQAGLFSTIYTFPDGSRTYCENYNDGYSYNYQDMKSYCESKDYECDINTRQGSYGTIYSISCEYVEPPTIKCYACDDDGSIDTSWFTNYDTCPGKWESQKPNNCPVDEVKCYKCNNEGTYDTRTFASSCDSGWSLSKPSCHVDVTCYACGNDGQVESRSFEDYCDNGWDLSQPNHCTQKVDCYQCQNGMVISDEFNDYCPSTWLIDAPSTCVTMVDCYSCSEEVPGTIKRMDFPTQCPTEWSTTSQIDCKTNWFMDLFDFEDEPVQSSLLMLSLAVLLYSIASFGMKVFKKK